MFFGSWVEPVEVEPLLVVPVTRCGVSGDGWGGRGKGLLLVEMWCTYWLGWGRCC